MIKYYSLLGTILFLLLTPLAGWADELWAGFASVDISPKEPVILAGQFHPRVSKGIEYPVEANVLVLESIKEGQKADHAILVSLDTATIYLLLRTSIREMFQKEFPDLDVDKIILSATHTHSAPVMSDDAYPLQKGVMIPSNYVKEIIPKIIGAIRKAWDTKEKIQFSYGLGNAVVAFNRRAIYEDGSAVMYGKTNQPDFRAVEGVEDHDVNTMFFWDSTDRLKAILVNVSCPSQENEANDYVSSDFWGPTRKRLHEMYGKDVVVLAQCGAAGDMSPHLRYQQKATLRMDQLRKLNRIEEIGRRIARGVEETYDPAFRDRKSDLVFGHQYAILDLPQRIPTKSEYETCKANYERQKSDPQNGEARWNKKIIDRYNDLANNPHPVFNTPINVLRIGDTVLCTNQFELYTDFSIQIKARSPAIQTFVAQLTNGWGTYLPSERAVKGGGYGAIIQSNRVGPEGGQKLVEETLLRINRLWNNTEKTKK